MRRAWIFPVFSVFLTIFAAASVLAAPREELALDRNPDFFPDILLQAKHDADLNAFIVERLRTLLKNNSVSDPFNSEILGMSSVSHEILRDKLDADTKQLLVGIGNIFRIDMKRSRFNYAIDGIRYRIGRIVPQVCPLKGPAGYEASADLSFYDIEVSSKEVVITLRVAPLSGEAPFELVRARIVNPKVVVKKDAALSFSSKIEVKTEEKLKFHQKDSTFADLRDFLKYNPDAVDLTYDDIVIPPIVVQAGVRRTEIESTKLKAFLLTQGESIKRALLRFFADRLTEDLGDAFLNLILQTPVRNDLWISSSIYSGYQVKRIEAVDGVQTAMHISGDFCSPQEYTTEGAACSSHQFDPGQVRRISERDYAESRLIVDAELLNGDFNLIASVSEHYLNRLLAKTVELKFWDESLAAAGLTLGPMKTFLTLDRYGTEGTLYIDAIYRLPRYLQPFAGLEEIRFPLVFRVSIYIVNENVKGEDIPVFVVRVNGAETSRATLEKGIPEFDYQSRLGTSLLKRRIVKLIQRDAGKLIGTEVLRITMPELKGMGLSQAVFYSDGHGRALGKLKVQAELK
ncbi:MAG: hypothetical protein HYW49_02025 [Deltaproteobacteria bacterium]|nr:hypothetical protein [Deltaproteobacteria bacterium]